MRKYCIFCSRKQACEFSACLVDTEMGIRGSSKTAKAEKKTEKKTSAKKGTAGKKKSAE